MSVRCILTAKYAKPRTKKGVSFIILTAKHAKAANKKRSVPCSPEAVPRRVQGEGFPSPPGWEPRAVKDEVALVRTLRVVRGSRSSNGVSVVFQT